MIIISYNDELGVLQTKTGGDLSIDEILRHYEEIRQNNTYPRDLKVIIDCRSTRLAVKLDDVLEMAWKSPVASNSPKVVDSSKYAIWIKLPELIVFLLNEKLY